MLNHVSHCTALSPHCVALCSIELIKANRYADSTVTLAAGFYALMVVS